MTCPTGDDLLLYAAGELAADARAAVTAHLEACPACRAEVKSLARGLGALETLEREPALRPAFAARLDRALRGVPAARPAVRFSFARLGRWAAVAAVAVLAVGLALTQVLDRGGDPGPVGPPAGVAEVETDADADLMELTAAVELLETELADLAPEPAPTAWDDEDVTETLDEIELLVETLSADDEV